METTQAQQLKLNVTNINSFLVNSNTELRRLRVEKSRLFDTQEKQIKVKEKENRIEKKDFGIGSSFSKIKSAVSSATGSIFDKIKEFFGLILLGILVNNLPRILSQLEDFFNSPVIKTIGSIINVIGNGIMTFAKIAIEFPKSAQTQFLKTKDDLEKKFDELEGIYSALIPDLEKYNQQKNGQSPSTQTPTTTPVRPGQPLNPQTNTRIPTSPTAPGTTTLPAFSKGGTVKSESNRKVTSSAPTPGGGQSGRAKQARQASDQGFAGFKDAVDKINENTKLDENNINAFEKMSYNFKTLTALRSGETPSTTPPGLTPPGQTTPPGSTSPGSTEFPYSSPTGDATIKIWPGQGSDASGEPGLDFSFKDYKNNYSLFGGKVIETGKLYGEEYGNVVVVRSKDPSNGKMFDALYAHFPPGGIMVKPGDSVSPGQHLGSVGWDEKNKRPVSGAGNMTGPHTSVDFYEPGSYKAYSNAGGVVQSVISRKGKQPAGKPKTNISRESLIPLGGDLKGLKLEVSGGGKGGGRNLSYNKSSMGGKNVMIMAIQPVETFIPMPYPMPIEKESSSESSDQYQVSSIWRA